MRIWRRGRSIGHIDMHSQSSSDGRYERPKGRTVGLVALDRLCIRRAQSYKGQCGSFQPTADLSVLVTPQGWRTSSYRTI